MRQASLRLRPPLAPPPAPTTGRCWLEPHPFVTNLFVLAAGAAWCDAAPALRSAASRQVLHLKMAESRGGCWCGAGGGWVGGAGGRGEKRWDPTSHPCLPANEILHFAAIYFHHPAWWTPAHLANQVPSGPAAVQGGRCGPAYTYTQRTGQPPRRQCARREARQVGVLGVMLLARDRFATQEGRAPPTQVPGLHTHTHTHSLLACWVGAAVRDRPPCRALPQRPRTGRASPGRGSCGAVPATACRCRRLKLRLAPGATQPQASATRTGGLVEKRVVPGRERRGEGEGPGAAPLRCCGCCAREAVDAVPMITRCWKVRSSVPLANWKQASPPLSSCLLRCFCFFISLGGGGRLQPPLGLLQKSRPSMRERHHHQGTAPQL